MQKILLITPPLVQINTPYPATAYLKGILKSKKINSFQIDLGLELILELFSKKGLEKMRDFILKRFEAEHDIFSTKLWNHYDEYLHTIDAVISFLQNKNSTLAFSINTRNFIPEGPRFDIIDATEDLFGENAVQDKARYLATLYIEDISDFITEYIDEHFGLSRYAERIARSAKTFNDLYSFLKNEDSFVLSLCYDILENKIKEYQPTIIAFSIPFPGNLTSALYLSKNAKKDFPTIKTIFGGGYCNTELREINDERFFEFVDFLTLDDGEKPIEQLIHFLQNDQDKNVLKRTFLLSDEGKIEYFDNASIHDYHSKDLPAPSYEDLKVNEYLSVIDLVNPMHRLWSDGRWNKMILAHGCYWAKCTFCDINLSYIADYHHASAEQIVNHIEALIAETGQRGFHFVDEAAPPALIKEVALELLRRNVKITWWTNIRFEKSFTWEICHLMVLSGCIAVSGGLEVASNRLLKLIQKGVTVEQVAQVCHHFKENGILVHAYLMFGFPTQTEQETIDSLELVRQLFEEGVLKSGYWHKFTMTVHSPCGKQPEAFQVRAINENEVKTFAKNDLEHIDFSGADHDLYSEGLNKALYNYMHNNCLEWPLEEWFDFKIPSTTIPNYYIHEAIKEVTIQEFHSHKEFVWLGISPEGSHFEIENGVMYWRLFSRKQELDLELEVEYGMFLYEMLRKAHVSLSKRTKVSEWKERFQELIPEDDFNDFMVNDIYPSFRKLGLLYL